MTRGAMPVRTWLDNDPFTTRKLAASRGDHEAKLADEVEAQSLKAMHKGSDGSAALPLYVPPLQFDLVAPGGIYRSGHPNERNFAFLRSLKLKSIVYLGVEDYRENMRRFAEEEGIAVYHYRLKLNREPFDEMDEDGVASVLSLALDERNLPMLIHCNKGKYRVGCIVGCLRKLQGWLHSSIFDEYARFAGTKLADQDFIETFDVSKVRRTGMEGNLSLITVSAEGDKAPTPRV